MSAEQNKITAELLKLIQENPELPVIPMVNEEVFGDDSGYWMGAFSRVRVDDYVTMPKNCECVLFKSDDMFEVLEDYLSCDDFENLPEDEDECRTMYDAIPWKKGIFVWIDAAGEEP